MATEQPTRSYGTIFISSLLTALLTLMIVAYNGIKSDVEKLDERKAEKDVMEVKLESINSNLVEIKQILKERKTGN